jgi:hypothetical protein
MTMCWLALPGSAPTEAPGEAERVDGPPAEGEKDGRDNEDSEQQAPSHRSNAARGRSEMTPRVIAVVLTAARPLPRAGC